MTNQRSKNEERMEILLALALNDTIKDLKDVEGCCSSPCPELEELVAWQEGHLSPERHKEIIIHLGECSKCYALWQDFSA